MHRALVRVLLLSSALLAFGGGTAQAGYYTVSGCSEWAPQASYYVGAYPDCSVRSTSGAPALSTGRAVFTAAPGTAIVGVRGSYVSTQQGGWQVGIHDFDAPGGTRQWLWCGPGTACTTVGQQLGFNADRFRSTRVGVLQICGAAPSCAGPSSFSARDVVLTVDDYQTPNVAATVPGGWVRGTQAIANDANDNTGISSLRVLVDGRIRGEAGRTCDARSAVPCPQGGADLKLDTAVLGDGRHTVRVEAYDASGNGVGLDRPIATDNTAPDPVSELAVEGGDGWRAANKFALSWTSPPRQAAPIVAAELELCPVGKRSGDRACRRSTRPAADFQAAREGERSVLKDLEVPNAGEWTAALWLRDEAGNGTPQTQRSVTLRHDATPPTAAFRTSSTADPTRVRVAASDATSGIAGAQIELQRRGESTWRALDTQLEDGGFAASLDDVTLPDGAYDLRARAVDGAGNERSTDRTLSGDAAALSLPVRIKSRLVVGKPRRVRVRRRQGNGRRYRTRLLTAPTVRYGRAIRLRGRLTTPGANPLPGTELQVFAQVAGQAAERIGAVTTSATGRFSFRVRRGASRIVSFRYPGTQTIRPDATDVDLRVRASTSFRPSRRSLNNGETVTFRGRLRGGWIPPEGKLIALQARVRGSWRPFATTRASQDGRWAYPYRFDGTRGVIRYRFRALVLREATYPFLTGRSGTRSVLVRGIR